MNHTMYVDYMTKFCHNIVKENTIKSKEKPSTSFWDKVTEKMAETAETSKAGSVKGSIENAGVKSADMETADAEASGMEMVPMGNGRNFSTKDMTLEEYKQYIYAKIAGFSINSSQAECSFSANITDAGFEAMKNDPGYEKWVLDTLQKDFNDNDPWISISKGGYVMHSFGESSKQYIGRSRRRVYYIDSRKAKKNYWKKREERRRKLQKQYEEVLAKRAMWKRVLESEKAQAIHANRMIARKENGIAQETGYVSTELAQAYAVYETYAVVSAAVRKLF